MSGREAEVSLIMTGVLDDNGATESDTVIIVRDKRFLSSNSEINYIYFLSVM